MKKRIKTVVFPVGGLGTRFLPATKATPKEMLPVAEKPLIQYAFEEAIDAGIEKFIFITGRNKNAIEDHFDNNYELQSKLSKAKKEELLEKTVNWLPKAGQVIFTRQQDTLGLGHAVLCAEKIVGDEPFAVVLADELFYSKNSNILKNMIDLYNSKEEKLNLIAIQEVKNKEDVIKYGIVDIKNKDTFEIKNIIEKPAIDKAPSNLSVVGKYIFEPEIFKYLKNIKAGVGGEIQLTDAIRDSIYDYSTYGFIVNENRFDCGSLEGYLRANIMLALNNPITSENTKKIIKEFYEKI